MMMFTSLSSCMMLREENNGRIRTEKHHSEIQFTPTLYECEQLLGHLKCSLEPSNLTVTAMSVEEMHSFSV